MEKSGKHLSPEEKDTIMKVLSFQCEVMYNHGFTAILIQSLKTLSGSISKLKEAAAKTVATNKGKPDTATQKPAPMQQKQQQTTDDLKAKADALRKQVYTIYTIIVHVHYPYFTVRAITYMVGFK